ncbi:hypothetical protein CK203_114544 [Vitis vinifera]|uniref:Uncharacterized protein n=1 Tax=Vitis vinifera TaxID=29760 RepID=A0A438FKJ1_VITVI|nr:hypothetical protein CK203_114544 [Vitis vinifera]
MEPNLRLGDSDKKVPIDTTRYHRLDGKLIYLSHTEPDIAFAEVHLRLLHIRLRSFMEDVLEELRQPIEGAMKLY